MKTRQIHPRYLRPGDRVVIDHELVRLASIHVSVETYTMRTEGGVEITMAISRWPEIPQVE